MNYPYSAKRIIKRGFQHIAAGLLRYASFSNEPHLLILMYHRILPASDERAQIEEPGMMVTPESFRMHLDVITSHYQIVNLSAWIKDKDAGNKLPKKACAITFDDGWADNYEFAFPILRECNVPATIFLTSDMIGTDKMFWPERLARTVRTISQGQSNEWDNTVLKWIRSANTKYKFTDLPPTQEDLYELIASAKILPDQEIHSRLDQINEEMNLHLGLNRPSLLSWEQVAEMLASGLIELGSHTCNHIRLDNGTQSEVLEKEVISSKKKIEKQAGCPVETFCFPNGVLTSKALEMVRQHYKGAVTTKSGRNTVATDKYLLHRIGIHQDIAYDETAFKSHISGWM